MTQVQRQAVLLSLLRGLRTARSWCGETHVQKTVYFLQEACAVPLGFNFIFYKYGPFSFDLNDELTALRADGLLAVVPEEQYGVHLYPAPAADEFLTRFPRTVGAYANAVAFVARDLGPKTVAELERLTTALYVIHERPGSAPDELVSRIRQLKPHVAHSEATTALEFVREFQARVVVSEQPC